MTERKRGFTLIEVLVVISILGVLMGLVTVLVQRSGSHRKKNDAKMIVQTYLPNLIRQFQNDFSRLPPMTVGELNGKYKAWKDRMDAAGHLAGGQKLKDGDGNYRLTDPIFRRWIARKMV